VPDLIQLDHVTKVFDGAPAVSDLTLSIPQGIIFGLLGPSGSGKTTTIRLMIGVHAPTSGEIKVFGLPPYGWEPRVREAVGYMPQISFLYPDLSVWENFDFAASVYGMGWLGRRKRLRELLEIVELWGDRGKLVNQPSGGMRKRLSLARPLAQDPRLVFLDEPTLDLISWPLSSVFSRFRLRPTVISITSVNWDCATGGQSPCQREVEESVEEQEEVACLMHWMKCYGLSRRGGRSSGGGPQNMDSPVRQSTRR